MRTDAPVAPPVALSIAGSDSGGGAGIQADLKTMEAHGVFGTTVVTAVTAQNTTGVSSVHVLPTDEITAQYDAVASDFAVGAVKTGMLATGEVIEIVADRLAAFAGDVVVDPVMVAATGDRLLSEEAEDAYEGLVAAATLVTPNTDEAAVLTGIDVTDAETARRAGEAIVEMGADAALVKGGHLSGESVVDTLVVADDAGDSITEQTDADDDRTIDTTRHRFEHPRIGTDATHGSGCTLSSAIAARLARGETLVPAVEAGTAFMERAVRYHLDVGEGPGAVHHLVSLREEADRTWTSEAVESVVETLATRDLSVLVSDRGMNVCGATPYAETPAEVAGVEGRIASVRAGIRENRGVRFGAGGDTGITLLAVREVAPGHRFAASCRYDDEIDASLSALAGPVVRYDADTGLPPALAGVDDPPVAVVDEGGEGAPPQLTLLAPDAATLAERLLVLYNDLLG
ncbi:bifunctional hydroxymethylpyrimidine kinase/phosphomethylpyrimidine kinase [Haloferacaceae archaeon DSL9]